jgi:hypothetical protein
LQFGLMNSMRAILRDRSAAMALMILTLPVLGMACWAAPARAQDYPRLGIYGNMNGNGYPIWDLNGTVDNAVLDKLGSYHEVVMSTSPITPYRPDVTAALRQRRPSIKLLAYVLGHNTWAAQAPDSTVHYPTRYHRLVRDLGGFLYTKNGALFPQSNVNLAKKNAQGRFIVAESVADLFNDVIVRSSQWDGIFMDVFCNSILWSQTPTDSIDYVRAGYPSLAAFDAAWMAGTDTLANRLRRLAGPNFTMVGNCAMGTKYATMNGWMRENFPFQNGGSWYTNMYRDPGGYFTDEARFRGPQHNYISSWASNPATPYSAVNAQRARYGLASASLGSGYATFAPSDLAPSTGYFTWWYDEYAVDRVTGLASTLSQNTGWLGQPITPSYSWVWPGSGPDAATNPGFEPALTGWNIWRFGGLTADFVQDGVGPPQGVASGRIHIPTAGPFSYYIGVSTQGTLNVNAGVTYSATFWAKASTARSLTVLCGTDVVDYAQATIPITTEWKRYQVALVPNTSGSARLKFWLGAVAGNWWLDDVHFQQGSNGVYRRDFQNGTVLVNHTSSPITVPLERGYRKIRGLVDPVANDGQTVTQVTLAANDARFLLNAAPTGVDDGATTAGLAWTAAVPNPSSGRVTLSLRIPRACEGSVRLYNVAGREVANLFEGAFQPGTSTFVWDGRDRDGAEASAGVYFVHARAGGETAKKPIVHIR